MKYIIKTVNPFSFSLYAITAFLLCTTPTYNTPLATTPTAEISVSEDLITATSPAPNTYLSETSITDNDPLLVVVLMVKNEASVITQTIKPFIDGGVKYFVIFDTGSTDGTQEIMRDFFIEHGITNFHIVEEPFVNFAVSRNRALEVTQELFPTATFMLMPDAEWYMHNVEKLLSFCETHKTDADTSYFVSIRNTAVAFVTARLIRCRSNVQFVGVVHEIPNAPTSITLPDDCYFEWRPSAIGQDKSAQRWKRDCGLLLEEHIKNPFDPRTCFYLAQTYDCLGDYENAYAYYQKRTLLPGPNEDHFITLLRLGAVAQQLGLTDNTQHADALKNTATSSFPFLKNIYAPAADLCPQSIKHYLEAFNTRPQRVEPLIKIAQYYLSHHMMDLAFLFAQRACQISYPEADRLFVEKYIYDFARYDTLGIAAWYVGEYEVGEWAVRKALEVNPTAPHLHFNLKLYNERKKTTSDQTAPAA